MTRHFEDRKPGMAKKKRQAPKGSCLFFVHAGHASRKRIKRLHRDRMDLSVQASAIYEIE
jgi:hypothetical protein